MKNKIKILIAYHRPAILFKSDILEPIHVGRDVALTKSKDGLINKGDLNWLEQNMRGDNEGDNISQLNRYFSELTSLYWAWKNYEKLGDPDYIGLMQYRRHFIFNENTFINHKNTNIENCYSIIEFNYAPENYLDLIGLNDKNIQDLLSNYDYVTVKECDFSYINIKSVKSDFIKNIEGVKIQDYNFMSQIVAQKYPHLKKYLDHQTTSAKSYLYQMFILPKNIFFEYMNFLFDVLFDIYKKKDFSQYSVNGQRTLGYLGEKLFDCYIRYLKNETSLKHKELTSTLIYFNKPYSEIEKLSSQYFKYVFKKNKYKLIYKLTFGNMRKSYKNKYKQQKRIVETIKNIKKGRYLCN